MIKMEILKIIELIISILAYAGFILKDPSVVQSAVQISQGSEMTKQQQ